MNRVLLLAATLATVFSASVSAAGFELTVTSYNVGDNGARSPSTEQMAAIVRESGIPDVLLIQDSIRPYEMEALAKLLDYPHALTQVSSFRRINAGILSKYPFVRHDAVHFESESKRPGIICGEVQPGDDLVLVCSSYLPSGSASVRAAEQDAENKLVRMLRIIIDELFLVTRRTEAVEKLLQWVKAKDADRVIIGGDFNTFPLSRPIRLMNERYSDVLWPSLDYFRGTYNHLDFPVRPRLDYIFYSGNLDLMHAKIFPSTAGDHFPVQATFHIPE